MSLCYYLLVYGLSMLTRLLLLTKSFRRSLLNYFISKVVHDLFSFRREVLANGVTTSSPSSLQLFFGFGSAIPGVSHSGGPPRKDEMGNMRLARLDQLYSYFLILYFMDFRRFCSCDLEVDQMTHTSLNLTRIRCRYTGCPNTDFLRQGFPKSSSDIA